MTHRAAFLIPVFNGQRDFDDTLRSLSESTLPCAVIAVDDGSQSPLEVRQHSPNLDVKVIRLARNEGIVGALNAGLRFALDAGYEFIARIDAGDYAMPHRLAAQIAYMESHPRCMVVGSDAEIRDENGAYCYHIEPPRDPRILARRMHERAWLLHPSVMFRSSVIRDVGLYTDRYPAAEDYEMFLRIAARHEVGVVPEPLIVYVIRRGGISARKARAQALSRLRIQLRYFAWTHWVSYYGLIRTVGTMLLPRNLKSDIKSRFLYRQRELNRNNAPVEFETPTNLHELESQ